MIVPMLLSCAGAKGRVAVREYEPVSERWDHLQPVRGMIESRDFDAALRLYQELLLKPVGKRHADLVQFDLGLLHAHYANQKKDYKKSLSWFSRVIKEHPRSPLAEEARIWSDILTTMEKTNQVDIELEEKMKVLK